MKICTDLWSFKGSGTLEYYEYSKKFFEYLEEGKSRKNGIRAAIEYAKERQDTEALFHLYYEFIQEDTFSCEGFETILIFPEYIKLFETHSENRYLRQVVDSYKNLLFNIIDNYKISMSQIIDICKSCSDFYDKFHISKRSYYQTIEQMCLFMRNNEFIKGLSVNECWKKSLQCPKDVISDFTEDYQIDLHIRHMLFVENKPDRALYLAKPILYGKFKHTPTLKMTYLHFAKYYFFNGKYEEAKFYAERSYRLTKINYRELTAYADFYGEYLLIFAYSDIEKALEIFKRTFQHFDDLNNPDYSYLYHRGVYHLMLQLEKNQQQTVQFNFPNKESTIYNKDNIYNISDIKEYSYNKAKFYADKLDERNENTYRIDILNRKY